jgi:hypothetical protein
MWTGGTTHEKKKKKKIEMGQKIDARIFRQGINKKD